MFLFSHSFRFWYISMVACYRNSTTCTWHYFDANKFGDASNVNYDIDYDIHLVNGNPRQSSANPFTFHFSFDQQYILEMNLIFLVVYLMLVPMQIYAVRIQKHPVTKLFTISLILEFISLVFILSYYINYTISGVGNESIKTAGDILDIFSRVSASLLPFHHTQLIFNYITQLLLIVIADKFHVNSSTAREGVGCYTTTNYQIELEPSHVNLDTILCFSRSAVHLESGALDILLLLLEFTIFRFLF